MKLKDGMLLYHGSYTDISNIDLEKCSEGKDFGRGFYLTSNFDQARSLIRSSLKKAKNIGLISEEQDYGYVTVFKYHASNDIIKTYEFDTADKEWLWFISQNRRKQLASEIAPLIEKSIFEAEIIAGKIANDTTNPVITTYLNGLYGVVTSEEAVNIAIRQLMPDNLDDQFCFITERAVACLKYQEAMKYVI